MGFISIFIDIRRVWNSRSICNDSTSAVNIFCMLIFARHIDLEVSQRDFGRSRDFEIYWVKDTPCFLATEISLRETLMEKKYLFGMRKMQLLVDNSYFNFIILPKWDLYSFRLKEYENLKFWSDLNLTLQHIFRKLLIFYTKLYA